VTRAYRGAAFLLAAVTAGLGVAILAVTAARGDGGAGWLVGALFLVAGGGRLYLLTRRP
jgi:DNA-binding transcriptional LysR family regulator